MTTALILAGAVAKGAFEAGVLSVIARKNFAITSIVATSAGALNGALYAAGLRFGVAPLAASVIRELWLERATWQGIVRPSLTGILGVRGLSSFAALEAHVKNGLSRIAPANSAQRVPISLDLVTTSLNGAVRQNGPLGATTFEHVFHLPGERFDSEDGRQEVCRAALASAAFPFLFVPLEVEGVGACIDGGLVNNAPISHAIDAGVERVIVVTGNPLQTRANPNLHGADLAAQAADIGINERLFRDLFQARKVNLKLEKLERVVTQQALDPNVRREIEAALGWRKLEIIEIRPDQALEGNAFSALGKPQLRRDYIAAGTEVAERVLAGFA